MTALSPPLPRGPRAAPLRRVLIVAGLAAAVVAGAVVLWVMVAGVSASLPDVASLERRAPSRTALMRLRAAEARKHGRTASVDQRWISYERISPRLRRAVLIAEDDAFFSHGGMDWGEMQASMRKNLKARRMVRGGSTITQQLAKNLFLSPERTLTRKLKEILLARRLEEALTKRRIFELYLNLIEWGDGIYGIEAAAQRHFGVSATYLDARQSALLAAVIINPRRFDPAQPNRRIERRARMILTRMWRRGFLAEEEYRMAIGEPAPPPEPPGGIFGPLFGPAPEPAPADSAAAPEPAEIDTSAAPADTTPVPER